MNKLLISILALLIASPAWSAQQNISTITTKTSREALRTAVNTELGKVQSNTTELYSLAIAAPWLAQATAPSITNVFWVDTSGASPVIKYYDGDSWEVAAAGEGGTYTLPVATSSILGGVKQGAGTSIAVDGTISVTASGVGLGTTDNVSFGNITSTTGSLSSGVASTTQGALILYSNVNPYTFGIVPAASPTEGVSLKAPPAMPTADNSLWNCDINGTCGWTDPATFATPTGSATSMTIDASGFNGNLATTDNTIQEIAQKVDDLVIGAGGYTNLTEFLGQTAWRLFYSDGSGDVKELPLGSDGEYLKSNGAALAPSWATPSGAAHDAVTLDANLGNNLLGLSTQQLTLDSQTANYIFAAPNGSAGVPSFRALVAADVPALAATGINITDSGNHFTGTTVETALQEIGALPTLAFGTGLTAAVDTPTAGIITVSVTANTYQAYDANMVTWPSAISATEIGYLDGLSEAISTSLSGKQATDADLTDLADGSLTGSKVAGYAAATASKTTTYTIGTDTTNESYGGTIYVTSATTITAPAVAVGMNFSVVTIGDIAVSLDMNATSPEDRMYLDGVLLGIGYKATNSSKAGDTITCQYYAADTWYCWSGTVLGGHWTDGN